jgi:excinuclease UvrABC nuclease subunit
MRQVITRRYSKLAEVAQRRWCDLRVRRNFQICALVDGGKGQVSMARRFCGEFGARPGPDRGRECEMQGRLQELVFADGGRRFIWGATRQP